MATISIMDPVTRIEGHMKVEVTVETVGGRQQVIDARCTGTLFRGFEQILEQRHPADAPVITQRICGVCPTSHGMTSVMALEDAVGMTVPTNARILRNLTLGANFIQSHILHFYLLAALDYIAGPQTSPWTPLWDHDFKSDSRTSTVISHLAQALDARQRAHQLGAVYGGRMPSSHAYIPGGFTSTPNTQSQNEFRTHLDWLVQFIRNVYVPDVLAVADVYSEYFDIGKGCGNLLAYGVFDQSDGGGSKLLRTGFAENGNKTPNLSLSDLDITESVTYSWYDDSTNDLRPLHGDTVAAYPKGDAYSWLKAPRYRGAPYEAGPLARMWVNGDYQNGISVMDRHAARAHECLKIAEAMQDWLDQLNQGGSVYSDFPFSTSGVGVGLSEAPRGALGHWVEISGGEIQHYQVVTPTCWNASPKDSNHVPGPMEQALIGTPIQNAEAPVEALRVIHSFDPCLSCAVHVMKPGGKPVVVRTGGS